jgi:hypothetical protein
MTISDILKTKSQNDFPMGNFQFNNGSHIARK